MIFKESRFLEEISECKDIIFDKTGTLTKAKLKVVNSEISPKCDLNLLATLLASSNHPVSLAVFKSLNLEPKELKFSDFTEVLA